MPDISHLFTVFLGEEVGNTLPSEGIQVIQLMKKGNVVWISLCEDVYYFPLIVKGTCEPYRIVAFWNT